MTRKGYISIWSSILVIMVSLPSVAQNNDGLEFYTQMAMSQTAIKADQEIPPMRNLPEGKGRYIICTLALDGMLSMNPPLAGVFDKAIR